MYLIILRYFDYYLLPCFFFLIILFIYLFLAVLGLHCCTSFSLVVASRGYSLVWCVGFSSQRLLLGTWALGHLGFRSCSVWFSSCGSKALEHRLNNCGTGLSCSAQVGSSWIRDLAHVPCIGRRILYHCATREAPTSIFLNKTCMLLLLDFSVLAVICCPSYSQSFTHTYVSSPSVAPI